MFKSQFSFDALYCHKIVAKVFWLGILFIMEEVVAKRCVKEVVQKVLCAISFILAITLSVWMVVLTDYPRTDTLSSTGEQNHALFIIWGVVSALAVYFNMRQFAINLKCHTKYFEISVVTSSIATIVCVSVIGWETWQRWVHIGAAMISGVLIVLNILYLLLIRFIRKDKTLTIMYFLAIATVGVAFLYRTISLGWFTALTQLLLINVILLAAVCSNLFERWSTYDYQRKSDSIEKVEQD